MQQAVATYGRVDGVANCVGSVVLKAAHTTSEEEFENTIRINLFSSFHVVKSSVKAMMKTGGGSVVLCTSAVARHGAWRWPLKEISSLPPIPQFFLTFANEFVETKL